MQNGLYVAVSAQVALQRRLETIADNVANMNTVGYRATGVSFESEMARTGETRLDYVSTGSDYLSRRAGGLVKTDNSLDFAVQGDGWFGIQTPRGPAYTRDGRARIDEFGTLRTLNGEAILDAGGAPILVDGAGGCPGSSGIVGVSLRGSANKSLHWTTPRVGTGRGDSMGIVRSAPVVVAGHEKLP